MMAFLRVLSGVLGLGVALGLAVVGCQPQQPTVEDPAIKSPGTAPADPVSPPEAGTAEEGPAAATAGTTVGTVQSLTPGDRGCHVEWSTDLGNTVQDIAAFELCDRTDLIGQQVTLTYEIANVLAADCNGDPNCGRSDSVNLVVNMEPVAE